MKSTKLAVWMIIAALVGGLAASTGTFAIVSTESSRIQFACTGGTGFTYNFPILEDDDLTVIKTDSSGTETTLALAADYTVTGAGNPSGGTVTLTSACSSPDTITIMREVEYTQETDYIPGDLFPAEAHEEAWTSR